jgi:CheY-like chemotaxis protein
MNDHHSDERDVQVGLAAAAHASEELAAFLACAGIEARAQARHVASVVGINVNNVRARFNGQTDWRIGELDQVAAAHGARLVIHFEAEQGLQPARMQPGAFLGNGEMLPCRFRLGEQATRRSALVAIQVKDRWIVSLPDRLPAGSAPVYHVAAMEIVCPTAKPRVAVLDDDALTADLIRDHFIAMGYDAVAFYDTAELRDAAGTHAFDAYILDWRMAGDETTLSLCEHLRKDDPSALVVLLSGQIESESAAGFFDTARDFDVPCFAKPVPAKILIAAVDRHIARQRRGGDGASFTDARP